jgi:hypothetical protein
MLRPMQLGPLSLDPWVPWSLSQTEGAKMDLLSLLLRNIYMEVADAGQ